MYNLSFNWVVLNSLLVSINRDIFDISILEYLRNILSLVFYSIVVSNIAFLWDLNSLSNFFIFDNRTFVRDIFYSRFPFYWLLLNSNWLLVGDWLDIRNY